VRHAKTTCFILFLILDNLVNQYSQILFRYELIAEKLDYKIIHRTKQNIYDKVNMIKEQIIKIKRGIIGLREIVIRLSGRKISVISNECRSSLLNLSGHSHMVVHECDSIREILNGLLGQIENALIQKMNKTMKILTSFAAIFLPLTLIAGIYGMNFRFMPELEWQYGYFLVLGSMVFCAGLLLYIFKKNDWF
jgi:magnesium/cobalt transport protein CorA